MAGNDDIARMVQIMQAEVQGANTAQAEGWQYLRNVLIALSDALNRHGAKLNQGWDRTTNGAAEAFMSHVDDLTGPLSTAAQSAASDNRFALETIAHHAQTTLNTVQQHFDRSVQIDQQWNALPDTPTPTSPELGLLKRDSSNTASAQRAIEDYKTTVAQTPTPPPPDYNPPLGVGPGDPSQFSTDSGTSNAGGRSGPSGGGATGTVTVPVVAAPGAVDGPSLAGGTSNPPLGVGSPGGQPAPPGGGLPTSPPVAPIPPIVGRLPSLSSNGIPVLPGSGPTQPGIRLPRGGVPPVIGGIERPAVKMPSAGLPPTVEPEIGLGRGAVPPVVSGGGAARATGPGARYPSRPGTSDGPHATGRPVSTPSRTPGTIGGGLGVAASGQGPRARSRSASHDREQGHSYRDDDLWTVPQGAPAVVESSPETVVPDPGPAVGR